MAIITGTSGNDTLTGTAGDDEIYGLEGNDILDGGDGDDYIEGGDFGDTIIGGAGADTMVGGGGSDTYYVDNVLDVVVEASGEGSADKVFSSVSYTLTANVERLELTGTATTGIGNSLNNLMIGNASANLLQGEGGNDTLYGGDGNDTLQGGSGTIDQLYGEAGDDVLQGQDGNDNLYGGADEDELYGGSGVDVLDGGTGADTMWGGADNDVYLVDDAGDVVVEFASEGTDLVRNSVSFTLTANVESMEIQGSGDIDGTGNSLGNSMTGNSGDNVLSGMGGIDYLYGEDGNDTLVGGTGRDHLYGGAGGDTFAILDESVDPLAGPGAAEIDTIHDLDFSDGDIIDLSAIDADINTGGDQAFTFVSAFTGTAGEAMYFYAPMTDTTVLRLDVDGDGVLDYELRIDGEHTSTHVSTGPGDGGWIL